MNRTVNLVLGDPWDLLASDDERSLEGVVEQALPAPDKADRETVALRLRRPISYREVDYDRVVVQARTDDSGLASLARGQGVEVSVYGVPVGKTLQDIDPRTWWRGGLGATAVATATLP